MNHDNDIEETKEEVTKKSFMDRMYQWGFFIMAIFGITLWLAYDNSSTKVKNLSTKYDVLAKEMSSTSGALNKQTGRADSMNHILKKISKYMPIAASIQYRDSVCSKLPYSPGDLVKVKPDSVSIWVVVAVSITGGKWQHKVSYLLRDSSGKHIEVEPETVY